jgi:hypothetical protein
LLLQPKFQFGNFTKLFFLWWISPTLRIHIKSFFDADIVANIVCTTVGQGTGKKLSVRGEKTVSICLINTVLVWMVFNFIWKLRTSNIAGSLYSLFICKAGEIKRCLFCQTSFAGPDWFSKIGKIELRNKFFNHAGLLGRESPA